MARNCKQVEGASVQRVCVGVKAVHACGFSLRSKLSAGSYVVSSPKYCIVLVMVCKRTCLRICSTPLLTFDSAAQRRVLRALRGLRPWEAWGLKRSTRVNTKLRA